MSFVVRKASPVVVRPSSPQTTISSIRLSPFDEGHESTLSTYFLVFDHPIHKPAESIKTGLSRALVHYYPFAGRLYPDADGGEVCIQCTANGVLFVAASAGCALKDVQFFDRSTRRATALLNALAIDHSSSKDYRCGFDDDDHPPLLLMQVTEFSCGGFVVGVTWNHVVADGTGMAQFLGAVAELTRGLPSPSVVPVRCDDSMPGVPAMVSAGLRVMASMEPQDLASLDITIPWSSVDRIRAEFRGHSNGRRSCTAFEAVAAVLWRCRTRAAISDPETPCLLSFTVDVRKHVGAKAGYYGNCVVGQVVVATSGAVANGSVVDVIAMMRSAKERIPALLSDKDGGGSYLPPGVGLEQLGGMLQDRYNPLVVTSVRKLGFGEADFGGGTPARVMCRSPVMAVPSCLPFLPWKGKTGVNVLARCVREEHADAFLAEVAKLAQVQLQNLSKI